MHDGHTTMNISVVVPAYNEEQAITETILHLDDYFKHSDKTYEFIVVDDGSKDGTATKVRVLSEQIPHLFLVVHERNHGKGRAIQSGVFQARGDLIILFDADRATSIEEFKKTEPFLEDGYDLVIGSRYLPQSMIAVRQSIFRIILSRFGNLLIQGIVLPGIIDTQCGFKVFSRRAAMTIFPRQSITRWAFDIELLTIARAHSFLIKEVPINWKNASRPSHYRALHDSLRTLRDLVRIKINLMRGGYR